jgi:hypothetical protein
MNSAICTLSHRKIKVDGQRRAAAAAAAAT